MKEKSGDSRTLITVSIITGIFGILAAIVTGLFSLKAADRAAQTEKIILATSTALAQEIQSGNSTQVSLVQTVSAPTATALPPVVITATSKPTERPTNTPTPSLPSFSDDFENGIKPDWSIVSGEIGMANGSFTVIAPFNKVSYNHLAKLDGYSWQNTRISVSLLRLTHDSVYVCDFPCGLESAAGIIIRYQPGGQSIGFFTMANSRNMALGIMNENFEWSLITSTLVHVDSTIDVGVADRKIMIDAIGDTYTVYIDGKKITSASIPGITEGQVGLWFFNSNSDQSPQSYSPRYDSFKVEGLP